MTTLPAILTAEGLAAEIYASEGGFAGVPFRVRIGESWSDWAAEPTLVTRRIPGSNASITQFLGLGPLKVQYQLLLPSAEAYAALRALIGTEGTLVLAEDAAAMDGETHLTLGVAYLELTDVLLVGIDPGSVKRDAGLVFCTANFQKDGG